MKRLFSLFLVFALLLSLCAIASAEEPDWAAAYASVLVEKQAEAESMAEEYGFELYCGYYLYDIDKDEIPEMIVKMGTCEADYHGEIYTFSDGEARLVCEDLGLGHSSLYSDPGENGVILMYGHMGYAWAERMQLRENAVLSEGTLYEDNLNERLETDPEAEYVYPGDVIPGSVYLSLFRLDLRLPLYRYEQIMSCLEGRFSGTVASGDYPNGDPDFYDKLINGNGELVAVTADGFSNSPGHIGFQELLKQNVADDWMDGDMTILSTQPADLNGDGQLECMVALSKGDGNEMRFYLSEQDGTVYAYLQNYANGITADRDGNLFLNSPYYQEIYRLFFDGAEAFLLNLPLSCYRP